MGCSGSGGKGATGPCGARPGVWRRGLVRSGGDTRIFWGALRRVRTLKGARRLRESGAQLRAGVPMYSPPGLPDGTRSHEPSAEGPGPGGRHGPAGACDPRDPPPPLHGLLEIPAPLHHFRGSPALDLGGIPSSGSRDPLAPPSALSSRLRWGCWRIPARGEARGIPAVMGTHRWRLSCCCCWGAGRRRRGGNRPRPPSKVNPPSFA